MSGRGDNNKSGSAGRGASNQSNQPFSDASERGKSYHGEKTGGKRSEPEHKDRSQSGNRNRAIDNDNK